MFVTAACFLFLLKLKWPKNKNIYDVSFFSIFLSAFPVVQRLDNAIHRINHYPADSVVCFVNTYPLDSDLSGG